jgi:hypothetical protein
MKASSLRLRMLLVSITVGVLGLLADNTSSRGEDVPFLKKENGPFMVLARTFRGPDAEKFAKALAKELRQEHRLPAYLFQANPRGAGRVEAVAVLVGDAKTLKESETIFKQVKAISPRCLADMPDFPEPSLARAYRITNPLVPKAELFPHLPHR